MEGKDSFPKRHPVWTVVLTLTAVIIVVAAISGGSDKKNETKTTATATEAADTTTTTKATQTTKATNEKSKPDAKLDRNTRRYISTVQACQIAAALVRVDIGKGESDLVKLADATTSARDTCDTARSGLLRIDTDHFDDQAAQAWSGVDRIKSGLNAILAYLDDPRPTKVIEARDKLNEGNRDASQGIKGINQRRKVYGLKAIK